MLTSKPNVNRARSGGKRRDGSVNSSGTGRQKDVAERRRQVVKRRDTGGPRRALNQTAVRVTKAVSRSSLLVSGRKRKDTEAETEAGADMVSAEPRDVRDTGATQAAAARRPASQHPARGEHQGIAGTFGCTVQAAGSESPYNSGSCRLMNGWTRERRARQAVAIRRWRPWEHSTGPRTSAGKARSSRNAYQGGHWRREREFFKTCRQVLREQRRTLDRLGVSGSDGGTTD